MKTALISSFVSAAVGVVIGRYGSPMLWLVVTIFSGSVFFLSARLLAFQTDLAIFSRFEYLPTLNVVGLTFVSLALASGTVFSVLGFHY